MRLTALSIVYTSAVLLAGLAGREGPRNPRALFRFGWVLAYTGAIARAEALYRDLV
jgi:hypothetical protein